jgi:hypothetical protein
MQDRFFHIEPLGHNVFIRDYDIHPVPAWRTVVYHRQQAVNIGRQITTHDIRLLVDDLV